MSRRQTHALRRAPGEENRYVSDIMNYKLNQGLSSVEKGDGCPLYHKTFPVLKVFQLMSDSEAVDVELTFASHVQILLNRQFNLSVTVPVIVHLLLNIHSDFNAKKETSALP